MDDISKFAYEGNFELLRLRIKEDRNLATKTDSVWIYLLKLQHHARMIIKPWGGFVVSVLVNHKRNIQLILRKC